MSIVHDTALIERVNDPYRHLTPPERTLLRKLHREGPAMSAGFRKGWMLGGTRYSEGAINRLVTLKLARFWRDRDGIKLALNDLGQLCAWKLLPPSPPRPDDD